MAPAFACFTGKDKGISYQKLKDWDCCEDVDSGEKSLIFQTAGSLIQVYESVTMLVEQEFFSDGEAFIKMGSKSQSKTRLIWRKELVNNVNNDNGINSYQS